MKSFDGYLKLKLGDNYILLAGGGHKTLSDFSMAHTHPYLPLVGGTMTGNITWNTDSHGIYFYGGCGIEKWSGYNPALVAEGNNTDFYIRNGTDRTKYYKILHTGNYNSYTPTLTGEGASGTWEININGIATLVSKSLKWTDATGTILSYDGSSEKSITSLTFPYNQIALNFRHPDDGYATKILYMTAGNEALVFATKSSITSFIFKSGCDITNSHLWYDQVPVPTLQLKGLSAYINKLIASGSTPEFNFLVNGLSRFDGKLWQLYSTRSAPNATCIRDSAIACFGEYNDDAMWIGNSIDNGTWILVSYMGEEGTTAKDHPYNLSLLPLSGKVGIGTLSPAATFNVNGDTILGYKSKYYQRSTRGQIHHEFVCDDSDYGGVKITHNATEGSGGPGSYTASLFVQDNRPAHHSGIYLPTVYIQRAGATRLMDPFGIDVGSRVFTVGNDGKITIGALIASSVSTESEITRILITPYRHTGGPWNIKSKDDNSSAFLTIDYNTTECLRIKHDGFTTIRNNLKLTGSYIEMGNSSHIASGRNTSFNYGYSLSIGDSANSLGIFSGPGGEEGAVIVTPDTCIVYNSSDTGYNFVCYDKDLGGNLTTDTSRTFSINQSTYFAWSRGGFWKNGSSDSYVLLGGGGHKAVNDFATSGHNHDGRYLRYEGWWSSESGQNINDSLGMNFTYTSHGAPHHWGTTVTFEYARGSSYRLQLHGTGDNYLYFRNRSADYGGWHSSGWKQILTNQDTYVASDGTNRGIINGAEVASARHLLINGVTWNSNWHWSGQGGQPSWLWGSNDGVNMYVWNPSNFSVNYANSAGSASYASSVGINYNNDSNSTYQMLWGSGNYVYGTGGIYCNPYTDYLYAGSFYTGNWFRSSGATGWYNESYGGGWYMSDANWIRTYNGKGIYTDIGTIYNLGHAWFAYYSGYNVGIGTTSPSYKLHVVGDSYTSGWNRAGSGFYCQAYGAHYYGNNSGDAIIYTGGLNVINFETTVTSGRYWFNYRAPLSGHNAVNQFHFGASTGGGYGTLYALHYYESSDIRYKHNITTLNITSEKLSTLPLFNFVWDQTKGLPGWHTGTSAQEVVKILPNIISGDDSFLTLDYGVLGTIAGITACKELVTLKSELQELKEKVKLLEDKLRKYKNTL